MTEVTKQCCRCLVAKPLVEFNLKPQAACKACLNIYQAVYRDKNRIARREKAKMHRLENREERLLYLANYRAANRKKLNAAQRRYASKEEIKTKDREARIRYREELRDSVIRRDLVKGTAINGKDIPPEIIEVKRMHIKIRRAVESNKKLLQESCNNCLNVQKSEVT